MPDELSELQENAEHGRENPSLAKVRRDSFTTVYAPARWIRRFGGIALRNDKHVYIRGATNVAPRHGPENEDVMAHRRDSRFTKIAMKRPKKTKRATVRTTPIPKGLGIAVKPQKARNAIDSPSA